MSTTASWCLMMAEKDLRLLVDGRETMEWPYCWVTLGLRRVQCWMFRLASRCECGTGGPAGRQLPFQDKQRYARVQPPHHHLPLCTLTTPATQPCISRPSQLVPSLFHPGALLVLQRQHFYLNTTPTPRLCPRHQGPCESVSPATRQ